MARKRKAPHLVKWRGKWYVFYWDLSSGDAVQRRVSCESEKATTPEARIELVKRYSTQEKIDTVETVKLGGRLAYDAKLLDELDKFLSHLEQRAKTRMENPEARSGVSAKTLELMQKSVTTFKEWLKEEDNDDVRTGQVDAPLLTTFFDSIATRKARRGKKMIKRRAATINQYMRNIRTALRWIRSQRPPRFPDFDSLVDAFRPLRAERDPPRAFTPEKLRAFLKACLDREDPGYTATVVRVKNGKAETFQQNTHSYCATPASRLFVVLTLTGARLGEVLAMKWADVDMDHGRITIRARKTGMTRILPLTGAPEGVVSPGLVQLMKKWRREDAGREYVLPHAEGQPPAFSKWAWNGALDDSCVGHLGPQMLRQNFTSYAASTGIPASVAAMWQGHGAAVAERHYRAQVLDRHHGTSLEEAMGLSELIQSMLSGL